MDNNTLNIDCANNIGQVKLREADEEIKRLSKNGETWVKDFTPLMYVTDETDFNMHNPTHLTEGFCWIITKRFQLTPDPPQKR